MQLSVIKLHGFDTLRDLHATCWQCYKTNVFRTTLMRSAFLKWMLMCDGQLRLNYVKEVRVTCNCRSGIDHWNLCNEINCC